MFTSCDKEKTLANRLDGKWNIDSYSSKTTTKVEIDYETNTEGYKDTSYTTVSPDENTTVTTTGTIDFISDNKLVMETTTVTKVTKTTNGVTTSTETTSYEDQVGEYYASGEDEITVVFDLGLLGLQHIVYNVTTNEKDKQVWENQDVDVDVDDDTTFDNVDYKTTTTETTDTKIEITPIED